MAVGDGTTWDETTPTDGTTATAIDDYNRDVRKGIRSRLALEHEMPDSQSATSEGGQHKYMTMQQQATAPTLAGTQTGAIWVDTADTLQYTNDAGDSPIGGGSHMITRGFELEYSSAAAFTVLAGTLYHGLGLVNKTADTTLTFGTASDWWDGAADTYAAGAGWCYVGVNQAGSVKLLGANPADAADSAGNTDGTLLYWEGTTYFWRVIGAVYVSTSDECTNKWYQVGDWVFYDDVKGNTNVRVLTSGGETSFTDIDCSAVIPEFGRSCGLYANAATGNGINAILFRINGSSGDGCAGIVTNDQTYDGCLSNMYLDSAQKLEYKTASVAETWTVYVTGYSLSGLR